jgi:hypothetical protein
MITRMIIFMGVAALVPDFFFGKTLQSAGY